MLMTAMMNIAVNEIREETDRENLKSMGVVRVKSDIAESRYTFYNVTDVPADDMVTTVMPFRIFNPEHGMKEEMDSWIRNQISNPAANDRESQVYLFECEQDAVLFGLRWNLMN